MHLAHLSDVLLVWAVAGYALAMLGYAAEFAFGRREVATDGGLPAWGGRRGRARTAGRVAVVLTLFGWGAHVASVVTRGAAAHRVPWGNMYEFSSMVSLIAVSVFLVLLVRHHVRFLGAFVMAPVVLYLGLAGTVLYAPAGPLVPALNNYLINDHGVAAITASGAFMVAGVITALYLAKDRWE